MKGSCVRAVRAVMPMWSTMLLVSAVLGPQTGRAEELRSIQAESQTIQSAVESPAIEPAATESGETAATAGPSDTSVTPRVRVSGHIWRMSPGLVFLRTPIGLVTLSCKTCLRDLRGGPTVTVYVHGARGAVHITPRGASHPSQRYFWGPMPEGAPAKKELALWTPEGEQSFSTERVSAKLAAVPPGRSVTFEAGNGETLIGVHDLHVDLQVSQLPAQPGNTELHVTGSVSKIKNGYVHVQTELGLLPITSKTGLCLGKDRCRTKVGEDLTLWIHDTNLAIDLHPSGSQSPARRLLSGKLSYAGPDKNSVSLWTPNGEQSFPTDQAKGVLASLKEGAPIIVELDADGAVHEIRKGN